MPNLHFAKLAPNTSQVVHFTVIHFSGFVKYHPRLSQLTMLLIKLSKLHPQGVRFACRQLRIHRLHSLCVGVNDLLWFPLVKSDSFMPLMDIVGVLTQKHAIKQKQNSKI